MVRGMFQSPLPVYFETAKVHPFSLLLQTPPTSFFSSSHYLDHHIATPAALAARYRAIATEARHHAGLEQRNAAFEQS